MLLQEQISQVIDDQQYDFLKKDAGLKREMLQDVPVIENFATIITGLRRCGKSTLLLQLLKEKFADALFLNFEDIRLVAFETSDFERLLKEIENRQMKILFFDEIQLIAGWEIFIHHLLRDGYLVFITGSNASLLSGEMATHLTGRQLSIELFPFSFSEFIRYKNLTADEESIKTFLNTGGIPEYVKSNNTLLLNTLVDDILIKDIAVRHGIKDIESLRQLALYLMCNIGNLVSANKLIDIFRIKSPSTLLEYFSYLKDAYLVDFVPQFSYSLKTQARNPKKVYSIDTGIVRTLGLNFSENQGHLLENAVYLHLRKTYKEIYYFKEKNECDFVVCQTGKIQMVLQVCYELNPENLGREMKGLEEAMNFFGISTGMIITLNQKDLFMENGKQIDVVPAYRFLNSEEI